MLETCSILNRGTRTCFGDAQHLQILSILFVIYIYIADIEY